MPPKTKAKKVPKGSHKMPDGSVMKDKDMKKEKKEKKEQKTPAPKRDAVVVKGLKDGLITQKQYDKMSDGLLKGIVKKGGNGGKKKK